MDDTDRLNLTGVDGAIRLVVHVVPRADRNAVEGVTDAGALRVRLTASPVEGAANASLIALLSDFLGIPKRDIIIVRGGQSREKTLQLAAAADAIRARLRVATSRERR